MLVLLIACCNAFPTWLPCLWCVCVSEAQLPREHMLQVRVAYFREGEPQPETSKLAQHSGRAHKLALIPEQPTCFYRQVAGRRSIAV